MKRYQKTIILSFVILFFGLGCVGKVANSEWLQHQIVWALTRAISENTSLKSPVISYEKITWGGLYHPLSLSVTEVKVADKSHPNVFVENIYASWSLGALISLKVIPSWFKFEKAKVERGDVTFLTTDFTFESGGDFKRINISRLTANIAEIASLSLPLKALQDINMPVEIQGNCKWNGESIEQMDLKVLTSKGGFTYAPYFPKLLAFEEMELTLALIDSQKIQTNLNGKIDNVPLEITATFLSEMPLLLLVKQGGKATVHVEGNAKAVPIDSLKYLWPVGLAPKPRHWVTTNLSKGRAKEATLTADMTFSIRPHGVFKKIAIDNIEGDIYPEGVSVNYLGKLPKVLNASGHAHYTNTQFIIDTTGIVNGMTLSRGHVVINNLDKKDQDIQIDLDVEGDIGKAFEIISAAPLNLTQKLGLNFKEATGTSLNHVELKFPLETNVGLDEVDVESTCKISNGKAILLDIIEGEEIKVKKGDLDLKVTKEHLFLTGKAELNGMKSDITWTENFDEKKSPFLRKLSLQGTKDVLWGEEESPFLKGNVPVTLAYQKATNNKTTVDVKISLSPLLINFPWASFYKNAGVAVDFILKTEGKNKQETVIKQGQLSGDNFKATVEGTWGKPASVIRIKKLKIGDVEGHLKLTHKNKRYKLQGTIKEIDAFTLLNHSVEGDEDESSRISADVFLNVKKVIFSESYALANVKFKLQLTDGDLQTVEIVDRNNSFNFMMSPEKDHTQHFILSSKNAAELLELLTPGSDFSGGKVHIVGKRKRIGKEHEMQGELDIRDLVVYEAPLLAKILSLTSVNGIMSILSGDGLLFNYGSARLKWKKDDVEVRDAILTGSSLGLTFEGTVKNGELNFIGEVIPFYALNSVLSKVPVIGNILSGDSNHAIFSTYFELKGQRDNTDIKVSPLTTFAPGGMRKMFGKAPIPPPTK